MNIPPESYIGIILYGTMCSVLELGFTDFPKLHVFKGNKLYIINIINKYFIKLKLIF